MSEEDSEQPLRRRSERVIALEEKKEQEMKPLAAARKNNPESSNNVDHRGKGKVVVEDDADVQDDDDDQHAPTKKRGRKSKALHQLFSSTQPMQRGQNLENRSTSRRNGSPKIPDKQVLEFVLDILQRKDADEHFAQPVNPDEGYYELVKKPMDFGTMRAKLHENMYTDIEQFKRDVYLICSNAMTVNPASSNYYKVAKSINELAAKVFHGLSTDPQLFNMQYGLSKKRRARGDLGRPRNVSRPRQKIPNKPEGMNSDAELEKGHTDSPSSGNSLFSDVMNGPKLNVQFSKPASNYQDSLVRFVQDMGPAAQRSAAKELETTLHLNQTLCGETPKPNPPAKFLDTTGNTTISTTLEPTSQQQSPNSPPPPATQTDHDAPNALHSSSLSNRSLTIPGFSPPAPRESINVSNIDNSVSGDNKGKKVHVEEGRDTGAAALLGDIFIDSDNVEGQGSRGLNLKRAGESSGCTMASPIHQRMSFLLLGSSSSFQDGNNNNNKIGQGMQSNTPARPSNLINASTTARDATPSGSSRVHSQVWPSHVISRPEPKPLLEIINTSDRRLAELCLLGQARSTVENPLPHGNLSSSSHQLKPEKEPKILLNLLGQAPVSQVKPSDQTMTDYNCTLPRQCLLSEEKPTGNNFSWQSFMPQLKPKEPRTCYNPLGESLLYPQNPSTTMTEYKLSGKSFWAQEKPPESMTGFNLLRPSFPSQQKPKDGEPKAGYDISGATKWIEQDTSNLYDSGNACQPVEFQATFGSTNFNNIFPEQASLDTPPPAIYGYSNDLPMQPKPRKLNSLDLFPGLMPKSSSSPATMPMDLDAMNYLEGNVTGGHPAGAAEQASLDTPPPASYGYSNDLPMQPEPRKLNSLDLFPGLMPKSSSSPATMPMDLDAMNYLEGNVTGGHPAGAAEGTSTAQLLPDDDQSNWTLHL